MCSYFLTIYLFAPKKNCCKISIHKTNIIYKRMMVYWITQNASARVRIYTHFVVLEPIYNFHLNRK